MAITLRLEGAPELTRALNGATRIVSEEERRAMVTSLTLLEADARRRVRQDTRRLMNSITAPPPRQDGNHLVGQVGPSVRYGEVVEKGRRPHRRPPPRSALRGWALRHNIPERALFLIARKIGRDGTPARPYMAPAWAANRQRVEALFAACGARIVARLAGGRG